MSAQNKNATRPKNPRGNSPAFLDSERQRYVAKVQSGHGGWSLVSLYWGLFGRGLPAGWPGLDQSDIVAEIAPCLLVRHWFCAEEPPAELLAALEHAGQELNTVALFATMLSQKLWRGTTRFDAMLEQLAQANEDSQKALQVQTALCAGDWQGASDSLAPLLKQLRVLPDEHQRIALVPLLFLQLLLGIRLDWEPHKLDDITVLPDQTSVFARFSLKPIQEYLRPLSMPARINGDLAQEKDKFAWCEYLLFAQRYRLDNMAPLPAGFDQRLLDLANFLQENTYVLAAAWLVRTLPSNDNPQYKSLLETVQQQPVCPQLWSQDIAPSRVDEFFRHCHDLFSGPETSSSATSDQTSGFFLVLLKKIEEPLLPEQAFSLQNVEPRLMSPASTSKPPQRLKSNQLHDPSIPPCFPENDRPFLNRLTVDSGSVCLPRDFWPNLCALTSLHFQYDGECSPGHLSPGRLPLLCNLAEDGKLRLQMPFQNLSLADKFILVRRDTDNWTFYHLDDKFITVKKLFRQYGDGQQLCLPASAEAKLRSLLPSLRHSFQLRGSGLPETLDGLTSADGTVELHILIHKRGDEYSLKLRNAPLPGRNLLQFPAQGELLSVVTCDGQDCLLRR
ncbi:MAG: hypothetical protein J6866_06945, partial [Victivallales bacterium]|nr:hypothetical protein [Victivallales bacterium]